MANRLSTLLGGVAICALLLSSCSNSPATETGPVTPTEDSANSPVTSAPASDAPATDTPSPEMPSSPPVADPVPPEPATVTQEESCDWASGPLAAGPADDAPAGPGDADLGAALVGAWQHTHIDSGAGFEPLDAATDIRFVFPSASRLLYCQDIAGILPEAENAADIELAGSDIVLPGDSPGYTVMGWNQDTMVWKNNLDGSVYLVKRR